MNKRELKDPSQGSNGKRKTENKPLPLPVPQRNSLEYIDPNPSVWNVEENLWNICLHKFFGAFKQ